MSVATRLDMLASDPVPPSAALADAVGLHLLGASPSDDVGQRQLTPCHPSALADAVGTRLDMLAAAAPLMTWVRRSCCPTFAPVDGGAREAVGGVSRGR